MKKTTSINSFIMWDVSIQWRDIKRDKQGIIRKIVNGGEFVKKISGIFDVWRYSADQGFEMKINKLWNAFSRVIVGRDYGPTGLPYSWVYIKTIFWIIEMSRDKLFHAGNAHTMV